MLYFQNYNYSYKYFALFCYQKVPMFVCACLKVERQNKI
ncbi:hypothetical protein, partial [Plasmodium yoelii yoelii]